MALFFVSLGFGVSLQFMYANLARIILLLFLVFLVKFVVFLLVNFSFGYRGRVAFFSSVGLTQVGEFAFVVFAQSFALWNYKQRCFFAGCCGYTFILVF